MTAARWTALAVEEEDGTVVFGHALGGDDAFDFSATAAHRIAKIEAANAVAQRRMTAFAKQARRMARRPEVQS